MFQVRLQGVSSSVKGVSRLFKSCVKEILMMFQRGLKGVSRKSQECFKKMSRVF